MLLCSVEELYWRRCLESNLVLFLQGPVERTQKDAALPPLAVEGMDSQMPQSEVVVQILLRTLTEQPLFTS